MATSPHKEERKKKKQCCQLNKSLTSFNKTGAKKGIMGLSTW